MTKVFGPSGTGWSDLRMSGGAGPFLPGSGYTFIFLEGSDSTAIELANYLNANRSAIENFVSNGGALLLNSAPNQGGNINFGFGGITLNHPTFNNNVVAANPSHPVFLGPYGATGSSFSGNYFSHAYVSGGGVSPIILDDPGRTRTILGEKAWGSGYLLVGGMTTNNWHAPQPGATTLRANIIAYTAGLANVDSDGDGFPNVWEILYGTDPNNPNDPVPTEDVDGDGLNWLQEFQRGTNPRNPDTDGDGVSDGKEVQIGTSPTVNDAPVTIVEVGPGAGFGTAYYRFVDLGADVEGFPPTGYRVYYGGRSGKGPADYVAFLDVGLNQFEGLIDQVWGMQGVPQVYISIAPIRKVADVTFVGPLSNEASTYFSGMKFTSAGANQFEDLVVSKSSGGCSISGRSFPESGATATGTLVLLLLPMVILYFRKRVFRRG